MVKWCFHINYYLYIITGKLVGKLADYAIGDAVFGLDTFDTTLALPICYDGCIIFYKLSSK